MSNKTHALNLPSLSDSAMNLLNDILGGSFLGASRNIRQINGLFRLICVDEKAASTEILLDKLFKVGEYLIVTRGRNTPAIANAIRLMLRDLSAESVGASENLRKTIGTRKEQYNEESMRNRESLARFGANLLSDANTVMAFDFSSTMMAILDELALRGRQITVIVPESRVLDGGLPIANEATAKGHNVIFILDMAFSHFIPDTDAVLIGAETIFANGDCWNTIGSYPIASVAKMQGVPFYVATELIKIDPRSFVGSTKEIKPKDYSERSHHPDTFNQPELVSVIGPEMDNVSSSLITAYVTPKGILPPAHLRQETLFFLESIHTPILTQ